MRPTRAIWLWLCLAISILLSASCGTPGVPQPPSLNLAKPVSDLHAARAGHQVTLTWTVPTDTTDGARFRHRGSTRACRTIDQPSIAHCSAISTFETPAAQKTATFSTEIPPQNVGPNDYATYAIEVLNDRGRSAGLSNQVHVPAAAISRLNGTPDIQVTADAILATVSVSPRETGVPQSLELRRTEKGTPQESTVAQRPLDLQEGQAENFELRDENFVWEKTYVYRVVLVGSERLPDGPATFDADISPPIEVFAHDIFPPAVPTGLQAVYSGQFPGQQPSIDLTWNPDMDRDLAGYFVYRRTQDQPTAAASKLNPQPLPTPSFHDANIQPDNTYFYSISAVDERGNESKHSEETSEQVPK